MDKINIVACTDNKFVMPTGVMMYSICKNHSIGSVDFHIIVDEGVSSDNKKKLEDLTKEFQNNIVFYQIESKLFQEFPAWKNRPALASKAAYYRLLTAEILPVSIDKVIYLDGDIIVRGSLLPLLDIDMTDKAIAAVPSQSESIDAIYKQLSYSPNFGYFNSGVLLINLSYWRENHVKKDFIDFIQKYPERIAVVDQDVLNYVFREKKIMLPIKYNFSNGFLTKKTNYNWEKYKEEVLEARKNPIVVHYAGGKPWANSMDRYPHPWRSLWYKYMSQTCWKDEPLWETRPWSFRIKKSVGNFLRRFGILPELPNDYIDIDPIE